MKILSITLSLAMALAAACSQQNEEKLETAEQEALTERNSSGAEDALWAKYPDIQNLSWNTDDHGNQEAEFEMDGEKYRADFDQQGQWIETENSIDYEDLPDAVKEAISEYDKDDIAEIEQVDNREKGQFYDVEFKQKGKNKDIEIRADGTIVK